MRSAVVFVGVVLLAAACYELALALGVSHVGPQPGDDVAGAGIVEAIAVFAMAVGMVAGVVGIVKPERAAALLAPAAGLFFVGMEYTYDPYYAPAQRRFAEGVSGPLIFALMVGSLLVGVFTWRWPRPGGLLTAAAVFVWGLTTLFVGDGH